MNDEMFQALVRQMKRDGRLVQGEIGAVVPTDEAGLKWNWEEWGSQEEFFEDLSGERLDPVLVRKARAEEMAEVRKHGLYQKRPLEECIAKPADTVKNRQKQNLSGRHRHE